ncbi:MAG TPA: hypothetical protein VFE47_29465 [Tepidisphaeraceae bacterium]|nr:hypothetical protein [Tepidisphaeraceae bacterium]
MNQAVTTNGMEYPPFGWEQLPAFVRGANRGAATPPPAYAALRVAIIPTGPDRTACDEDEERWDGLS